MAGLDLVEIDEVIALIRRVRERGISVLVIERVIKAIKSLSDRIFVLNTARRSPMTHRRPCCRTRA
jgi:branched-chain amino acid transport system ATP-binding protein